MRQNGPASCEQPPSLIATELKVRAHTLPTPRPQEGELEAAHTLVASSALGSHANKAAQGYLTATTGEMRKDFVWDRQMANFPHGAPHFPEVILATGTIELTHKPLKVNQVLRRQNGLARVDHTQVPIGLMTLMLYWGPTPETKVPACRFGSSCSLSQNLQAGTRFLKNDACTP